MVKACRDMINDPGFKAKHRLNAQTFVRDRVLTFPVMMVLILRKSVKSLQLWLNELSVALELPTVTASAFSQARQRLKHTAFIELNQKGLVKPFYEEGTYQRWQGWRLLAIDGSEIRLPNEAKLMAHFGQFKTSHEQFYTAARASVMYDVLNQVVIASQLAPVATTEVALAQRHLSELNPATDLCLFDRGYSSYQHLATLTQQGCHFVVRAKRLPRLAAMFDQQGADSQTISFAPGQNQAAKINALELPPTVTLRVVRVILSTGEVELLITSLSDEQAYLSLIHI